MKKLTALFLSGLLGVAGLLCSPAQALAADTYACSYQEQGCPVQLYVDTDSVQMLDDGAYELTCKRVYSNGCSDEIGWEIWYCDVQNMWRYQTEEMDSDAAADERAFRVLAIAKQCAQAPTDEDEDDGDCVPAEPATAGGGLPTGPVVYTDGSGNILDAGDISEDIEDNFAEIVLQRTNEQRAAAGLAPLRLMPDLCEAAQIRAKEAYGYFSHTRPDGSDCLTVIQGGYTHAGENLAQNHGTAAYTVRQWMDSPGHRENILYGAFTELGVGCYSNGPGYAKCWVQLFRTR